MNALQNFTMKTVILSLYTSDPISMQSWSIPAVMRLSDYQLLVLMASVAMALAPATSSMVTVNMLLLVSEHDQGLIL